jgi:hypothetical protein
VVPRRVAAYCPLVCDLPELSVADAEGRLRFLLVYLKTCSLQVVQGQLFGMGQSMAHHWIHVLLVVLRATRRTLGDAPVAAAPMALAP